MKILPKVVTLDRRTFVTGASSLLAGSYSVDAQVTVRPLKIVVGFPAGGGLDLMVRAIADRLQTSTSRTVIVENRPGAAGRIAAEAVVRSDADGSTLLAAPIVATAFYPYIFKSLTFDPLVDLAPITRFATFQFALAVNAKLPVSTLREFVSYAKANVGKLSFGSLGAGTPSHFLGVMLNQAAGIDIQHVPYRGSSPAIADLLGGSIQAVFDTTASLIEQYRSGALKLLAVTGSERSLRLPDVPTFQELKLGLGEMETADLWYGLFAAGKTSTDVIEAHSTTIREVLLDPAVRSRFAGLDVNVVTDTPAAFAAIIKADHARWGRVIRATGFTLE